MINAMKSGRDKMVREHPSQVVTTVREEKLFLSPLGFSNRGLCIKVTKKKKNQREKRQNFILVCMQEFTEKCDCYNSRPIYYLNRGRKEGEKHLWKKI